MTTIFGALGLADNDRAFVNTLGQRLVFDAVQQVLADFNSDLRASLGVFLEETTTEFKRRYKLPGGGYMQQRGAQGRPFPVKAGGEWDVAFPLEDWGDAMAWNDVDRAYMTLPELQRHLDTVQVRAANTARREVLKALFNNTAWSFLDQTGRGTLSIKGLASGDSDVYPPVAGSDAEATENHYLESGYLASAIDNTNNPLPTIREDLEEHFGGATLGGANIVVFCNNAQTAKIEALASFDEVNDRYVIPGATVDQVTGLPAGLPGVVKGRSDGVWVVEWRWIPANYLVGIHLDAPKPLIRRVDPAETGLGEGDLQLVATDEAYPFTGSFYRHRYGFAVGNRLNGVVMELGNGGTYTVPTAYAR